MRGTRRARMKRLVSIALIVVPVLLAPVTAFAQEGSGLTPPQGPSIGGVGGSTGGIGGTGGTPFTGAEVAQLIALAIALVVVGVAALLLTRRGRAARAAA
jgi:hypothetical protein